MHRPRALRNRTISALVAATLAMVAVVSFNAAPVAADPRMPVQISPQTPSVASGEFLTYNAFVSCSIPAGCLNAVFVFSAPPAASGPGVVAQPLPPEVSSVTQLPNGDVEVVFATLSVGSTKQLVVSWPTVNGYTVPGPQPVTITGTADNATGESTDTASMDVTAVPNLSANKTGPANVVVDTDYSYSVNVANSGLSRGLLAIDDFLVVDQLPPGVVFVSAGSGGVYDPVAHTVTWTRDTGAAIPGNQFIGSWSFIVTVRVPSTAVPPLAGTTITNNAAITGVPLGSDDPVDVPVTVNTNIGIGPGEPNPTIDKTVSSGSVGDGQLLSYNIDVRNTGTAAGTAIVTDDIPAGIELTTINAGPSGTVVDVDYADGTSASFNYTSGTVVDLRKVGTRITSVTLTVPSIAANGRALYTFRGIAHTDEVPPGSTVLNCAEVVMGGITVQDCAGTVLTAPQVGGSIAKTTSQAPVNPGGTHTWNVVVASTLAPLYPNIVDLIPNQLEYVDGSFAFVSTQSGTCPPASDYTVSTVQNLESGRDAVIFTGNSGVILSGGTRCTYSFQTVVKDGAASGTYTGQALANRIYMFDQLNQPFPAGTLDIPDLDQDGLTTDRYVAGADNFAIAESSAADIVKSVQGDLDDNWLGSAEVPGQEDQIGRSQAGGTVQWQLTMGNQGNRNITDLVAYDLLPDPASPGVTDGRYDDTKPYEWVPTMTGPIATNGAPVTITYSTETDPCRPEMDATAGSASFWCGGVVDPSFVDAASVADWSAIRSMRFDFGDHVFAGGDSFTFEWTMDVPTVGPDGQPLADGAETWNKSAVKAARLNGDGSTLPLLPAEAPWVVDVIDTPAYAIGDYVWIDEDADGTQDAGEPVVEGVTVSLTDEAGNPVTDLDGNVVADVLTDANGTYHFDNLPGGSYIVTFTPPAGFSFTTQFAGTDTLVDSNADVTTGASDVVVLGPSNPNLTDSVPFDLVTAPKIDRTIDAGLVLSGTPEVEIVKTDGAGNDADIVDDAVAVDEGATTDLVFTITNSGTEPLVDIEVTGAVTAGSATVSNLSCDFSALGGPATGTTWAGPFAVGAEFGCTALLSVLTPGEPHTDVATVTGAGQYSGDPVEDDNPYNAETTDLVSIGDYVWIDTDRDGVQAADEVPVAGVIVNLLDANGDQIATTTTDVNGFYSFTGLLPSTEYQVEFVAPPGMSFTQANSGFDDALDSDADPATGLTVLFTTPATGENSATDPDDPTWDAGLVQMDLSITKSLVTVGPFEPGDTVEFSLVPRNNGPADALAGWSVTDVLPTGLTLVSISGTGYDCVLATATCTDTTGVTFPAATDGAPITVTATIDVDAVGPLHNVAYVAPEPGDIVETNPLEVPTTDTDTDSTNTNNDDQADLDLEDLVSIGDYVWIDTDRDGVQAADEVPVAGVIVNLLDANGDQIATTTTDVNGFYSFTGLTPSTEYQVEFVAPPGMSFTQANSGFDDALDSDADPATGLTVLFTTPATGENSATDPDDPTWGAGLVQMDLSITKSLVTVGPFEPGDTVEFSLVPRNNGPADALAGWSVTDVLPTGLTLVSISGTGYDCVLATATCTDTTGVTFPAATDGAPITVTATIDAGVSGPLHNVAFVSPSPDDIDETNPLEIPTTDTDTDNTNTNNDDQADLTVDIVTTTTTTTTTVPDTTTTTVPDTTTTTVPDTTTTTVADTTTTTVADTTTTTVPDTTTTTVPDTTTTTVPDTTTTTVPDTTTTTVADTTTTVPASTTTTTSTTTAPDTVVTTTPGTTGTTGPVTTEVPTTFPGPFDTLPVTEPSEPDTGSGDTTPGADPDQPNTESDDLSQGGPGTSDSELSRTGSDVGGLLQLAGACLLIGLVLTLVARNRRRGYDG